MGVRIKLPTTDRFTVQFLVFLLLFAVYDGSRAIILHIINGENAPSTIYLYLLENRIIKYVSNVFFIGSGHSIQVI